MRNAIRQTYFLFLALSLTLILADCCLIDNTLTSKHISSHRECSDISDTADFAHSGGFEDDTLSNDTSIKADHFSSSMMILPDLAVNIENSYILYIWQPPKLV